MVKALGAPKAQEYWQENLDRVVAAWESWVATENTTDSVDEFEGTVELIGSFAGDSTSRLGIDAEADIPIADGVVEAEVEVGAGRKKNRAHDNKIIARVVIKSESKKINL